MDVNGINYTDVEDVVVLMFGKDFKGHHYLDPADVSQKLINRMIAQHGPIGGTIVQYNPNAGWPGDDVDPVGAAVVATRSRLDSDCLLVDLAFADPDLAERFRKGEYMPILRARGGNFDRATKQITDPSVVTVDITETEFLPKNVTARQVAFLHYRDLIDNFGAIPGEDLDNAIGVHHLAWMARELATNAQSMDPDKAHRWLGFIQGGLVAIGAKTVDELRNITRPYFA